MVITDIPFSQLYGRLGSVREQYCDIIIPARDGYQLEPAEGGYWMWPHQWFWDFYVKSRAGDMLGYALENALEHGNQNDPARSFSVKLWLGEHGTLTRIRDEGKGFPHATYVDMLRRGDLSYCKRHGRGLKAYEEAPSLCAFEDNGSTLNIFTPRAVR